MQKTRLIVGAVAVFAAAGLAQAQFNVTIPNGTGSIGSITNASPAATAVYGVMDFAGDLTQINASTFASEADWLISVNGGTALEFDPTTTTSFSGTINITAQRTGIFWANAGDNWAFETEESFDDGDDGLSDSQWDNTSFAFSGSGPSTTSIGQQAGMFTVDTDGSVADTEIAVYTADGQLIGTNDDNGGGGLWSLLDVSLTTDTTYLLVVGGYNSAFGDSLAATGTATGDFVLNIDGQQIAAGTLAGGDFFVYEFTIPTPGTAALLGIGGLAAIRRRR